MSALDTFSLKRQSLLFLPSLYQMYQITYSYDLPLILQTDKTIQVLFSNNSAKSPFSLTATLLTPYYIQSIYQHSNLHYKMHVSALQIRRYTAANQSNPLWFFLHL